MLDWHPHAHKVIIPSAPQNLTQAGGGKKCVWHSTEGSGIDGAVSAYKAAGVCPHFTIQVLGGQRTLYQHLPLHRAASALRHAPGTRETNRANAIQVEIVGFAAHSAEWPEETYRYLNILARWIHTNFGVPMSEGVNWRHPTRMTPGQFYLYNGHCGHMHAPGNDHTDPGSGFHIGKVLKPSAVK